MEILRDSKYYKIIKSVEVVPLFKDKGVLFRKDLATRPATLESYHASATLL